jgi:hypothetical protein
MEFSNIAHLKRNREIEAETGIDVKIDNEIYLSTLAASDANPRWRDKAAKAHNELKRLANAGATPQQLQGRYAELYTDSLVTGWHGGYDDDGNKKPGGPRVAGELVPFSRPACIAFLTQADDAIDALDKIVFDTKNFRAIKAGAIADVLKND